MLKTIEKPPNPDLRGIIRGRITCDFNKRFRKEIQQFKRRIIQINGREPSINYYCYSVNPINYAGYDNVKKSLQSICNQGEVLIGDYMSDDGTRELAKECGAKILDVERKDGSWFPESRLANKIFFESKANFLVYINLNCVYPSDFSNICEQIVKSYNIQNHLPIILGNVYTNKEHTKETSYIGSQSPIIYRPYMIAVRGYDERVEYKTGSVEYAIFLLTDLLKLQYVSKVCKSMKHRYYTYDSRMNHLRNSYNFQRKDANQCYSTVEKIFKELDYSFKSVVNSYW